MVFCLEILLNNSLPKNNLHARINFCSPLLQTGTFGQSRTEQLTQTEKLVEKILSRAINRIEGPEVGRSLGGKEEEIPVAMCVGGDGIDRLERHSSY